MPRFLLVPLALMFVVGCNQSVDTAQQAPAAAVDAHNAGEEAVVKTEPKTEPKFDWKGLNVVSFEVEGMTCPDGCAVAVEETLAGLEGVEKAQVDFPNKIAYCKLKEGQKLDSTVVAKALDAEGFELAKAKN